MIILQLIFQVALHFNFLFALLSLDFQEYDCSSRDLDMSRGIKWMAAKKILNIYLKWLIDLKFRVPLDLTLNAEC